ncbi:oxygenase MpaB family protein [Tsukamurella soli]|uniref:Oxygenase MpaB family protein n=1 Tax=Tsukamurella soli TaxID=644556 RepID=A0ABP8JBL2_9ACTN
MIAVEIRSGTGRDDPSPAQRAGCRIVIAAPHRPEHVLSRFRDSAEGLSVTAGPANVIMQLSWPGVGYGVMESRVHSGALFRHPIKRTRTTFTYLAVVIFGSDADRASYRAEVDRQHRQVFSDRDTASPVKYHAMDPHLQLWVAMCLYVGFEDTHELLRGRMSDEQKELFYVGSEKLGTTLQVRPGMWPATRAEFETRWIEMCQKILTTDATRGYLRSIVDMDFVSTSPLLGPLRRVQRFLTAGYLAPVFREAMQIEWSARDQRSFDRTLAVLARVERAIPLPLAQLPYRMLVWDLRIRHRLGRSAV